MTQVVASIVSAALLGLVLELVRRRKLTEEYSILWIVCATALLVFSLWGDALHFAAHLLGIAYPPAVLILVLVFFVFVVSLSFSVVVSRQRQQIDRLVEELALMEADIRDLRRGVGTVSPAEVIPGAPRYSGETGEQRRVG
jgi:hypothetical protein